MQIVIWKICAIWAEMVIDLQLIHISKVALKIILITTQNGFASSHGNIRRRKFQWFRQFVQALYYIPITRRITNAQYGNIVHQNIMKA